MAYDLDCTIERTEVRDKGLDIEIVPTAEQLAELCFQYEIKSIPSFSARIHVRPWHGADGLALEGQIEAKLIQECIVSGEEVRTTISEPFTVHLLTEEKIRKMERRQERGQDQDKGEIIIDVEADDPPDVLERDVSIGSYVSEYFSLFVDPYPRSEGVSVAADYQVAEDEEVEEVEEPSGENPFAVLSQLKKND